MTCFDRTDETQELWRQIGEQRNLAASEPEVLKRMEARLDALINARQGIR